MKRNKRIKATISGRFRLYFSWPLILTLFLIAVNGFIYLIDKESAFIMFFAVAIYAGISIIIYIFGKVGFKSELIGYAMGFAKTERARLKEMDIPYVITDADGNIHWSNNAFFDMANENNVERKSIFAVLPELTGEMLRLDGFDKEVHIARGEKEYRVVIKQTIGSDEMEKSGAGEKLGDAVSLFFYDVTEINALIREIRDKQMIMGLLYIDNYEEALESIDEVRRSLLSALVDRKITRFMQEIDAVIRKLEKDKYILIFKNKYLEKLKESRFSSLLEDVKNVNIGNNIAVTISMGIGISEDSYTKSYDLARAAIDMALGRGGDQVVIKEKDNISYYGGKSQHVEKTTRVKARVKAHALSELIEVKDNVLIMGHKMSDVDAVGAAIGVYRICKTFNTKAHIVINDISTSVQPIIDKMNASSDSGGDIFVTGDKALTMVDGNTMLVVVDVNRQSYVECEELLHKVNTIVLLDHHRQGADVIDNAVLSYIEPYSSSSCEMVAEILQYIDADVKIKQAEADAMYSGIMIDTNNFLVKTGVRTFEAAAFLRRNGADVTRIRKAFRTEMDEFKSKAKIVSTAEVYREHFAFAECLESEAKSPTILAAQVANELMNISNVRASFVFTLYNKKVYISARSIDEVNVQVVMEKLGGGGHMSVAGAQLENMTVEEAEEKVKAVLDSMIEKNDI